MTKPAAQPKPREENAQAIAPRVTRGDDVRGAAPGLRPIAGVRAPRVARRTPTMRARVGPVESARAGATRRASVPSPVRGIGAPRVTRRAGPSRARVEGTPPSRQWSATRGAGRPTRERGPRAAAGPAARPTGRLGAGSASARPPQWRRSRRAAAARAAPRRGPR
jgi:hypothetical protein